MSQPTSISGLSTISPTTVSDESDVTYIVLSQKIQTDSLTSHLRRLETDKKSISWETLIEWFVEAVIGVEHFRNELPSAPPLTFENIQIDASSTISIVPLSSTSGLSIVVVKTYYDWKEWETMMEKMEQGVLSMNDLSFLQSPTFRPTLRSLQTKHQLRANPHQIEENNETQSSSDEIRTFTTRLPSEIDVTWNGMDVSSSKLSTVISTQATLPSLLSSSDSHSLTSAELLLTNEITKKHSQRLLMTIHLLLTRPPTISMSSYIRPSFTSESVDYSFPASDSPHVDPNEKFNISLFDETDDSKVVKSLLRCRAVLEATHSTECIPDLHTFRSFLISGLHSSNSRLSSECGVLFFRLGDILQQVDDPRDPQFQSLQKAFQDGTHSEQMALLQLWEGWFFRDEKGQARTMRESDFDFGGLLTADLSESQLFEQACLFVASVLTTDVLTVSFQWKMDFLLRFEKRHKMISRLSTALSRLKKQTQSKHLFTLIVTALGSFLSLFCGCDFSSVVTELTTTDSDSSRHKFTQTVNPAYFLGNTSIAPKHRHSIVPMDLLFERCFRFDPHAFLRKWPSRDHLTPRQFLLTPYVGLHSLLLRCPRLNLDAQALGHFLSIFMATPHQDSKREDIFNLFDHSPPPRLIDTVLSRPNLVRSSKPIWISFLTFYVDFGEFSAPFGACSSLAKVFRMLAPLESKMDQLELDLLRGVGEIVVALHWLSIPAHFDSPLLCHLPSLAGAQRGILQTLSSHSGIPSLITPLHSESFRNNIRSNQSKNLFVSNGIHIQSLSVRYLGSDEFRSTIIAPIIVELLAGSLISRFPAPASAAFEFFHRYVCVASDAVRMDLVKRGLELNKAFVGFSFVSSPPPSASSSEQPAKRPSLSTGHWGCGAFNGNRVLKIPIEWLAASEGGMEEMRCCAREAEETKLVVDVVSAITQFTPSTSPAAPLSITATNPTLLTAFAQTPSPPPTAPSATVGPVYSSILSFVAPYMSEDVAFASVPTSDSLSTFIISTYQA
ncbi:hypothetical protein BLNAU_11440 [Blattamonas nauphoetae]|uniref:PARG catalytic Macro domain-containing protein n=1 Tax=Blattamonas nauphoetae TaxID=2049346 RepID=A0ABQ9XSE4_9EUKA|nr:hypothetical protein BLNAU_11440 [Blattamonas nauphoetae]